LHERFKERNGSIVCSDLMGNNVSIPEEREIIKEKGLLLEICSKMVIDAAKIVEQLLI